MTRFNNHDTEQEAYEKLDLYKQAINAVAGDDFLERNQLGLGHISDDEMWQQVESYKSGMYGEAAFGDLIDHLLVEETKRTLAREAWQQLGDDDQERRQELRDRDDWDHGVSKRAFVHAKKEELWENLTPEDNVGSVESSRKARLEMLIEKIEEVTGQTPGWTPPHWRMLLMRLDSSRSRGARLIDNLFDRVNEQHVESDVDASNVLGGGS